MVDHCKNAVSDFLFDAYRFMTYLFQWLLRCVTKSLWFFGVKFVWVKLRSGGAIDAPNSLENGKPVARRGRKAMGLRKQIARLPKDWYRRTGSKWRLLHAVF